MKKCNKCGTVQNNSRTQCVDCGAVLGKPLSDAEEAQVEDQLDDKLDDMAERIEDFYVPLRDNIMGVICIIGIIASIILLSLVGAENGRIKAEIPDNVIVQRGGGVIEILSSGEDNSYQYPSARVDQLDMIGMIAILALITFTGAFPMLFFPKFTYMLSTLKYRLFYNWDTTPSYFAIALRKVITYVFFAVGVGAVLYGYYLYL